VDGGGLVLKMWICMTNISRNRKYFAKLSKHLLNTFLDTIEKKRDLISYFSVDVNVDECRSLQWHLSMREAEYM